MADKDPINATMYVRWNPVLGIRQQVQLVKSEALLLWSDRVLKVTYG
jgi:hypothetical protein